MKRFYTTATAAPDHGILLDGKPVRTPGGLFLCAPAAPLAHRIAAEWNAQYADIVPGRMPLTQLLTTQLERVGAQRDVLTHAMLRYLNTDLLCYRTDNEKIAGRQAAAWDPWLLWFGKTYAVMLAVTDRLQVLTQPDEAQDAVRAALDGMDAAAFTVAQLVTSLTGSVVLGLAFTAGDLSPDDAFAAANVDEIYKSELYDEARHGKAPNQETAEASMRAELAAAVLYLELTRPV